MLLAPQTGCHEFSGALLQRDHHNARGARHNSQMVKRPPCHAPEWTRAADVPPSWGLRCPRVWQAPVGPRSLHPSPGGNVPNNLSHGRRHRANGPLGIRHRQEEKTEVYYNAKISPYSTTSNCSNCRDLPLRVPGTVLWAAPGSLVDVGFPRAADSISVPRTAPPSEKEQLAALSTAQTTCRMSGGACSDPKVSDLERHVRSSRLFCE